MNNFSKMNCLFSVETIRETAKEILKEQDKKWNDMQIDILVQGVENSDWLKINGDIEDLEQEINEWILMLEEEWKEENRFGY